ncbi:MAG: hypothetical protein K2I77_04460 [Anaeroplasmataceae bacterium]|nr:hypothetical protein [Anaeroplasmataceae bacterium]
MNGVDIFVLIVVILLVIAVIFVRFILPRILNRKLRGNNKRSSCCERN